MRTTSFIVFAAQAAYGMQVGTCVATMRTSVVARVCMSAAVSVSEEEAKRAWLSRLDGPTWGKGVVASTTQANKEVAKAKEEEAKKAWLARLDAPTWGKAAGLIATIAKEAEMIAAKETEEVRDSNRERKHHTNAHIA